MKMFCGVWLGLCSGLFPACACLPFLNMEGKTSFFFENGKKTLASPCDFL